MNLHSNLKEVFSIEDEITFHPSWMGHLSGLDADKLLRGQKPFTYILREGESRSAYYVTFVQSDKTVRHTPFVLTQAQDGWYYENGGAGGPFNEQVTIDEVIPSIIHCEEGACTPLTR